MGTTRVKVVDLSSAETAEKKPKKTQAPKVVAEAQEAELSNQTATEEISQNSSEVSQPKPEVEAKKPAKAKAKSKTKVHTHGAKYKKAASKIEEKNYSAKEAFEILPQTSFTKFDPTVEVHLGVSEKNLKVNVTMPHLKTEQKQDSKYLIFADKKELPKEAQVIWGEEKTIKDIEDGTLKPGRDFTVVVAAPKYMPKLAKVAKILGPKGLMPNPKNGTVTEDIEKLFDSKNATVGMTIKTDPTTPVIHTKIGKLSQNSQELEANFKALVTGVGIAKIKKATITTTMGPAINLDTTKLLSA